MNQEIPTELAQGRYTVGASIGHGGMAEVHLGTDTRLGRQVAIKIMRADFAEDKTFLSRFRREAHSVAMLNNPNIVSIYDTGEELVEDADGETHNVPYIVMEYVKGQTLRDILKENGALSVHDTEQIMLGVLNALEYSHRMGIVHRDIKPGNIMISDQGVVKVMDFGIARAMDDSATTMTKSQGVVGTAQYLSPEQARGEEVDMRSDLYSAGCVLYEMLVGRPPFVGDSPVAIAYQHVSETATPPSQLVPGLPRVWDQIVANAMAKERQNRYATAAEFKNDILRVMSNQPLGDRTAVLDPNTQAALADAGPATQQFNPFTDTTGIGAQPVGNAEPSRAEARAKKAKKKKIIIWSVVAGLIALLALTFGIIQLIHHSEAQIGTVPTITEDMTEARAKQLVEKAGFVFKAEQDTDSSKAKGMFTRQSPQGDTKLKKGSTVKVWFSAGPAQSAVPDVQGMSQAQATATLKKAGFVVGSTTSEDSPTIEKDMITRTDPKIGSVQPKGSSIILYISTGRTTVPDVSGKPKDEAQKILTDMGFSLTIQTQSSSDIEKDSVISTDPAAGNTVDQKSMITLVISSGPDQVSLPSVASASTVADAMNMLANRGVTVTLANGTQSDYVHVKVTDANGKDITNGGTVDKGSTITVFGSKPVVDNGQPQTGENNSADKSGSHSGQ